MKRVMCKLDSTTRYRNSSVITLILTPRVLDVQTHIDGAEKKRCVFTTLSAVASLLQTLTSRLSAATRRRALGRGGAHERLHARGWDHPDPWRQRHRATRVQR